MKKLTLSLLVFLSTACLAADVIYLPNLQGSLTGSAVGSKKALDASVVNTVIVTPSPNPMPVTFPGGVTANQGTPGPSASPWPVVDDAAGATLTSIDGKTPALVGGRVPVDGSGVTQPVSAASLPLPTGAATEATLGSVDGYLSSIATFTGSSLDAALSTRASEATVSSIDGKTPALVGGRVPVDGSGVTQPVSATSLPLPTGAATLTSIDGKTPALVTGRVPVDGSGVTQPVSAASLPLPTGAATEATLSTVNGKLPSTVAADRTTAAAPSAARLSDGASFYNALTDAELRASAVPVSFAATQTVRIEATAGQDVGASNILGQNALNVTLTTSDGTGIGDASTPLFTAPTRAAEATDVAPGSATGAAESETAPADAVGFILSADGANTDSIRYRMGGTASATAGHELEPGRDSGYIPAAANLSIFAVSGTQAYQLTWVRR